MILQQKSVGETRYNVSWNHTKITCTYYKLPDSSNFDNA